MTSELIEVNSRLAVAGLLCGCRREEPSQFLVFLVFPALNLHKHKFPPPPPAALDQWRKVK